MRSSLLLLAAAVAALFGAVPQSGRSVAATIPLVGVSPVTGDLTAVHTVTLGNLAPGAAAVVWLFAPDGAETPLSVVPDSAGNATITLSPPEGAWETGLYRVVVGSADRSAVSASFTASDGTQQLVEAPSLPSPTSAFAITGMGFPAGAPIGLTLTLTGGLGDRAISATADANGTFTLFLWPQQFNLPFFPAGLYRVRAAGTSAATSFYIREHPAGSTMKVDGPAPGATAATLHLRNYPPDRFVWALYSSPNSTEAGELLVGPTSNSGALDVTVPLGDAPPGSYNLASPYDWGETSFTVADPPPTATPTPPATSTPKPKHSHKACTKKHKHAKACRGKKANH